MTYKERFMQCDTLEDLIEQVKLKTAVAISMQSAARIDSIEEAANEVIKEKGWNINDKKYDTIFGGEE